MAITDIPTSFGSSFFIKIFLPGFVASILYSYAVMPIIACSFWASVEGKLILWTILAIVFGMAITSLDLYIYQIFEGFFCQTQYGGGNMREFKDTSKILIMN